MLKMIYKKRGIWFYHFLVLYFYKILYRVEYYERICPKKHLLFYFFLIDFSPFTTGCDYRNYENDINIFLKI